MSEREVEQDQGLFMKYFVLKPAGEGPHALASRKALIAYSKSIRRHDELLANQLWLWAEREKQSVE